MTLEALPVGEKTAQIKEVGGEGALRCRLLDMGLIPGTLVTVIKITPMGDPIELRLRGYELTIRMEDAKKNCIAGRDRRKTKSGGDIMIFALAGNQNCGKTTLFNQLTGANQHVGNFPG